MCSLKPEQSKIKWMIIDWIYSFPDVIQEPLDREIEFADSVSNVGSKVRGRPASSLNSSRGSRASSAMAAKKATLKFKQQHKINFKLSKKNYVWSKKR